MSVLEKFKLVELITTRTDAVATFITGNQIKFNSATHVDLGYPAYIQMFVDDKGKQFARAALYYQTVYGAQRIPRWRGLVGSSEIAHYFWSFLPPLIHRLVALSHWAHIRTLYCMGNGVRSNKKTLLTIMVGSVFSLLVNSVTHFWLFP